MSLKNDIATAQQEAMKSKESDKVSTLRLLSSSIKNEEIKKQSELGEEEIQNVIRTQVKQLKDALVDFENGGRDDLVRKYKAEIELLNQYLPAQLSDEEIEDRVGKILEPLGSKEEINFGSAMGVVMKELKGMADGERVRELIKKYLES